MPSRGTGTETFPTEVWIDILKLLRNPVPAPLSAVPRWELRQTALARAIPVWKKICTPLLYRTVVTDDLCSFLHRLRSTPSNPRKLLTLVENLFVEYQEERGTTSYYHLMKHGDRIKSWELLEVHPDGDQPQILYNCEAEVDAFILMMTMASKTETRRQMPRLRNISVSSIYGNSGCWGAYEDWQRKDDGQSNIDDCVDLWDQFLATSNVENCCMWVANGPLGMNPISRQVRAELNRPRATIHFTGPGEILCCRLGSPVRWVLEAAVSENWRPLYGFVAASIARLKEGRNRRFLKSKIDTINLDISCSTEVIAGTRKPTHPASPAWLPKLSCRRHPRRNSPSSQSRYAARDHRSAGDGISGGSAAGQQGSGYGALAALGG